MNEERFTLRKGAQLTRLVAYVSALLRDKDVEIIVKEHKPTRSNDQNAMLWAIYSEIIQRGGEMMAGWTKDDLHELFLQLHFGSKVLTLGQHKKRTALRRSSRLNKQEFSDFVDFILQYMAEQGVYLQMPGEMAA
jgi:uncharacterized protein YcgL (UPF0745 family)